MRKTEKRQASLSDYQKSRSRFVNNKDLIPFVPPKSGAHGLASGNRPKSQRPSAYTNSPSSPRMPHNLHRRRTSAVADFALSDVV